MGTFQQALASLNHDAQQQIPVKPCKHRHFSGCMGLGCMGLGLRAYMACLQVVLSHHSTDPVDGRSVSLLHLNSLTMFSATRSLRQALNESC